MKTIFVFGSNQAGRHLGGAALEAVKHWGAREGQGAGLQGDSYAITVKDHGLRNLKLETIERNVKRFIFYANLQLINKVDVLFKITEIACEADAYTAAQISPMFKSFLDLREVSLPDSFIDAIKEARPRRKRTPPDIVFKILEGFAEGKRQAVLAKEFGLSLQTVCTICKKAT